MLKFFACAKHLCCTVIYVTLVCGVVLYSYLCYPCMRCCVVHLSMLPLYAVLCCTVIYVTPVSGVVLYSYLCYPCMRCCVVQLSMLPLYAVLCCTVIYVTPDAVCGVVCQQLIWKNNNSSARSATYNTEKTQSCFICAFFIGVITGH